VIVENQQLQKRFRQRSLIYGKISSVLYYVLNSSFTCQYKSYNLFLLWSNSYLSVTLLWSPLFLVITILRWLIDVANSYLKSVFDVAVGIFCCQCQMAKLLIHPTLWSTQKIVLLMRLLI